MFESRAVHRWFKPKYLRVLDVNSRRTDFNGFWFRAWLPLSKCLNPKMCHTWVCLFLLGTMLVGLKGN